MGFKKNSAVILLVLVNFAANAQDAGHRGYVGIGMGPAFLPGYDLGGVKAKTGLSGSLANFSYVFGKGFGVSLTWMGGAHLFDGKVSVEADGGSVTGEFDGMITYGALMIGPMYSLALSDKSSIDFKVRGGGFLARETLESGPYDFKSEKNSFGYSLECPIKEIFPRIGVFRFPPITIPEKWNLFLFRMIVLMHLP